MAVLLLRLAGPMQSWGLGSRFRIRDSALEPTKSGVVGLLCAALGAARDDDALVSRLAALPMGVRADREGVLKCDYVTAGGNITPGSRYGAARANGRVAGTVVQRCYYLADADFLVGLQSDDSALLQSLDDILRHPLRPLCLGRRSYVPAVPVRVGVTDGDLLEVLQNAPFTARPSLLPSPQYLRVVIECRPEFGEPRHDVPLSFAAERRCYTTRYVQTIFLPVHCVKRAGNVSFASVP